MTVKRKKIVGLVAIVLALALCGALSFAWFTSSIAPVSTDVKTAKIQITGTGGEWSIAGDEDLLNKALPGEKVEATTFMITNDSNREAVAKIDIADVKGTLKLANQTVPGTQPLIADAYKAAINADTTLSMDDKTEFLAQITADGIVINKAFKDFAHKSTTTPFLTNAFRSYYQAQGVTAYILAAIEDSAKVVDGIDHFYAQLVAMSDELTAEITAQLPVGIDSVVVDGVTYVALGIPTAANRNIDFNLSYTIPAELGGEVKGSGAAPTESHNWNNWFNEQESTFSYSVGVKAVQGTEKAITDVFGASVTAAFTSSLAGFLTNN